MSEWFDSHKNPSSNLRKLLQERIKEANLHRKELTKAEQVRLDKLNGIAASLRRGKNVQNRQLQTWLIEDEYAQVDIDGFACNCCFRICCVHQSFG